MTRGPRTLKPRFRVVHELPGRLRLKSNTLRDPSLDTGYIAALIKAQPGVRHVRVNQPAASIVVEYGDEKSGPDSSQDLKTVRQRILNTVNSLPQGIFIPDPATDHPPDRIEVAARILAAVLTPFLPPGLKALLGWGLALPTLFKAGETLIDQGLKVEVLDGSVKLFALLRKDYFTSNTVGAMLALAEHVEHATQSKTNDLLAGLLRPQADNVRVRKNGLDIQVPFQEVRVGDLVLCGPGEMLAVDGRVLEGEALLNTASISGESLPVHVVPGHDILSGGVVEEGNLVVQATSVGSDTSTARITNYIERSLRASSQKQERTEKLADRLVPLTFGLGLGIFAVTGSLSRAASVLSVDYSCAVKLATPVAVRAAMYSAGREGILLKGAQALESFAKVDTIVFDKTGTLTRGALQVTDVIPFNAEDLHQDELLSLAAGAEQHYAHPVAAAVVAAAAEKGLRLPEMGQVDFVVAHGVSAYVTGQRVLVGSRHFIHEDEGIDCSQADKLASSLQDQGKSLLYVARDGRLQGIIGLRDSLRPETRQTLQHLRQLGIDRMVMLTGDQERAATALWTMLPELNEIHAECKPEDKARIMGQLKKQGRSLAFVGDGVNDAPALVAADVGVSMPSGAELARDVAQVLLLKDNLSGLVQARQLALRTETILQQCLWSSVGVNTAVLGLAGSGYLPAVASAAIHNSSTIGVLSYAALRSSAPPQTLSTDQGGDHDSAPV